MGIYIIYLFTLDMKLHEMLFIISIVYRTCMTNIALWVCVETKNQIEYIFNLYKTNWVLCRKYKALNRKANIIKIYFFFVFS